MTDKPEPMSADSAVYQLEHIESFPRGNSGWTLDTPRIVATIRSLDERARKAEEQVERLIATRGR